MQIDNNISGMFCENDPQSAIYNHFMFIFIFS